MFRTSVYGTCLILASTLVLARLCQAADPPVPVFGQAQFTFGEGPAPPVSLSTVGFSLVGRATGPQVAVMGESTFLASLEKDEQVRLAIPVRGVVKPFLAVAQLNVSGEGEAEVVLARDKQETRRTLAAGKRDQIRILVEKTPQDSPIRVECRTRSRKPVVRVCLLLPDWTNIGSPPPIPRDLTPLPITLARPDSTRVPPPSFPSLRPAMEQALVEWDWRMQDGIQPDLDLGWGPIDHTKDGTWKTLTRCGRLLDDLKTAGVPVGDLERRRQKLLEFCDRLDYKSGLGEEENERIWREAHVLRREAVFRNPLAQTGPIAFIKQVPASFSHELTEYLGRWARPGGGVFVLENPGKSMKCRKLAGETLPAGSFQHLDISYEGDRLLFAFCAVDRPSRSWNDLSDHYFHLYEVAADGSGLRQLTKGAFNDFAPRYLPNGQIVFVSTRRGGWHRCGGSPGQGCENFTLALANRDGSEPHTISYHETQEWDPAVLNDGRVLFTRWDYVDRHAVFYQQLFTVMPDGKNPATYYGNMTFNPVGTYEGRAIPGSRRIMATAGATTP